MKPLVIAAHAGHELLLWKWLRNERPDFVVLTNGAGSSGTPRLEPTLDNLARAGANWIPQVVEPVADADIYRALLEGDIRMFARWLDALTAHVLAQGIDCIVADEAEDYNPSHDLCRLLANQVAAHCATRGHGVGLQSAVGRRHHGARLHGAWRPRMHFGDVERGATSLRRIPGGLPEGRFQHCT